MSRKAIGGGAYVDESGRYWERPGGKTWRLLRHIATKRDAIKIASSRDPKTIGRDFESLAMAYTEAGCPDARLQPRNGEFVRQEKATVLTLIKYFETRPADKMSIADLPAYHAWRVERMPKGRAGNRAVDKDSQVLSNIFRYALVAGLFPNNPFKSGRPRYHRLSDTRHSRLRAPKSADTAHQVCADLLFKIDTQSVGWLDLFAIFTGCRVSELIRLRVDAKDETEPGFISWRKHTPIDGQPHGLLHIRRSKGGINPECIIGAEFAKMIQHFAAWHQSRFPDSPWYFPNSQGEQIHRKVVHEQTTRTAKSLGLHITPHGFRSFYVTKRRSDGVSDTVIASEIGDKTVSLMQTTYGERPRNWLGEKPISWLPDDGKPAWEAWLERNRDLTTVVKNRGSAQVGNEKSSIFTRLPVWRNGRRTGLKKYQDTEPIEQSEQIRDSLEDYQI